jgi:hypothetical protein
VKGGAYSDTVVADSTYKDQVVGVPVFNSGTALYYNKDMLADAGLTTPPSTMDQIWDYASKLAKTDASGNVTRSGLSLRLSGQGSGVAEKFWILLLQSGHELVKETSPGHYAADYNGPDGLALFSHYVDSLKNNYDSLNIEHDAKAFETKATAMFAREPWVVADIATNSPDLVGHYGSISLPTGDLGGSESMYVPTARPMRRARGLHQVHDGRQAAADDPADRRLAARPAGPGPELVPLGQPGLRRLPQEAGRHEGLADPTIAEFDELETKLATHPRRRLCGLRQPVGPSRQDPDVAQHVG